MGFIDIWAFIFSTIPQAVPNGPINSMRLYILHFIEHLVLRLHVSLSTIYQQIQQRILKSAKK